MGRRVPLARRYLFGERRRAVLATAGIAVALLLVLVIDGIVAGAMRQVTAYVRNSPADVIVSQAGVRTMHMSTSALPAQTVDQVRAAPGVRWVEPIWFATGAIGNNGGRELSYVIGYTPGQPGGPGNIATGHTPGAGEAVVDHVAADQLGMHIGSRVRALGRTFRVVGLSTGGTSIVNTTMFITATDFAALRGPAPSYILVGARRGVDAEALRGRLAAALPTVTVQTRGQFETQESHVVSDMTSDTLLIGSTIGFVIALAVIALTLFTVTMARLHDYGVLKALGARPSRLAGVVLAQAAWSVALAVILAFVLAQGVGAIVGKLAPTVSVLVTPGSVLRIAVGGAVVATVAALVPLRRVLAVDPASAFRSAS